MWKICNSGATFRATLLEISWNKIKHKGELHHDDHNQAFQAQGSGLRKLRRQDGSRHQQDRRHPRCHPQFLDFETENRR